LNPDHIRLLDHPDVQNAVFVAEKCLLPNNTSLGYLVAGRRIFLDLLSIGHSAISALKPVMAQPDGEISVRVSSQLDRHNAVP
jgi:hypothetical protein